jgi:hypothetical protein
MFRPFYFTSTLGLFSGSFTSTPGLFDLYIRSCLTHDSSHECVVLLREHILVTFPTRMCSLYIRSCLTHDASPFWQGSFTSTLDLLFFSLLFFDASPFWQGSFTSTLDLFLPLVRSFLLCLYSRSLLPLHQVSLPLY